MKNHHLILMLLFLILFFNCSKKSPEPVANNKVSTPPELTTHDVSSISDTSAVSGGTIISVGVSPPFIAQMGVCWSEKSSPTIADNITVEQGFSGNSSFTSNLKGLKPNTTYFVRAYASNGRAAIGYGNSVTFTTLKPERTLTKTNQ